jgi:hypothetical protein
MLGPKVLVFGGQVEGFFFNDLVAFDLNTLNAPNPRWELIIPAEGNEPPPSRTNHIAITHQDKLYVFGGTNGVEWYNDMWRFDPHAQQWSLLKCSGFVPQPREGHAASLVGDVIYVFGGRDMEGNDLGDLAAFKISTSRWFTFQNMGSGPSPRSGHALSTIEKRIFVVGGEGASVRGDEQMAYILDTTKIRYPAEAKSPPSQQQISAPLQDIQYSNPPAQYPRVDQHVAANTIRSVSGQSVTSTSRLPGPVHTSPKSSSNSRPPTRDLRDLPPIQTAMPRRISQLPVSDASTFAQAGRARPSTSGSARNISQPIPSAFRQQGFGSVRSAGGVLQEANDNRQPIKRSASLDSLAGLKGQRGDQTSTSIVQPRVHQAESLSAREDARQPSFDQSRDPLSDARLQPPPRLTAEAGARQLVTPLDMNENRILPIAAKPRQVDEHILAPPLQHAPPVEQAVSADVRPPQSATSLAQTAEMQSKVKWLEAELALARRQGYLPSSDPESPLEPLSGASPELLSVHAQVEQVRSELQAAKSSVGTQVAQLQSERDAAVKEAAFERARSAALIHGDAENAASLEHSRCVDLEERLGQAVWEASQVQRELDSLRREFDAKEKVYNEADATLSLHAEALTNYETRYEELFEQHEALQQKHLDLQTSNEQHLARAITAESSLAQMTVDAGKLRDLEDRHTQHITVVEQTQLAVDRATQQAAEAEQALETERGNVLALRQELAQVQGELAKAKAEAEAHASHHESLQRDLVAAREDTKTAHKGLASGLGDLVSRARNFGPHDDPTVYKAQVENLSKDLTETRALHETTRQQADTQLDDLKRAREQIAKLEKAAQTEQRVRLAAQRQLASVQRETLALEQKHAQAINEGSEKQALLDEAQVQLATLQHLVQEKTAQADVGHARRDSGEKRRSRQLTSPGSVRGMVGSTTPDASRLREVEQKLAEAIALQREMQASHDKAVAESQALSQRHAESLARQEEAEAKSIRLEQELAREGSTAGSATEDNAASRSLVPGGEGEAAILARRASLRQSALPKEVTLAQARASEAERQLAESTQNYKERLGQLEADYQSAVHYVKGTEKMLRRMKEELGKYKSANARLLAQVDEAKQVNGVGVGGDGERSLTGAADVSHLESQLKALTLERTQLSSELDQARATFEKQASLHKSRIEELESELAKHNESKNPQAVQQMEHDLEEVRLANRKLEFENRDLERRMKEAESKVSVLLDQFEQKVDTYRRSMIAASPSTVDDDESPALTTHARTSSVLDQLSNELDQLRAHWQRQQAARQSDASLAVPDAHLSS